MADDFYLFANCNFVPDRYDDWQAAYDDLATYVWAHEPTTKTYYFGIPIDYAHDFSKTTSMFAFEIYGNREGLYETHLKSTKMQEFLGKIPRFSTTNLDLNHYRRVSGFLDLSTSTSSSLSSKPEPEKAGIMQDITIHTLTPTARSTILTSLHNLITPLHSSPTARASSLSQGILTFMAFASVDCDTEIRIFGRWRTRDDMEAFIKRDDVVGFWMEGKGGMRSMSQRLFVENGRGWLHRGMSSEVAGAEGGVEAEEGRGGTEKREGAKL